MCGIVGVVHPGEQELERIIPAMCEALQHRGPDDEGVKVWPKAGVALGHRRLSIIDLTPTGHQPMCNEDGTVWIVFNGEIYNFKSLRRELEQLGHNFCSKSDTEVIIHAYEEWGDAHVHRLRGMFAYALYDGRLGRPRVQEGRGDNFRLFLVRDRLGIKPIFYYWDCRTFIFASEIKAILACPGVDRTLDRSAIFDYLTYVYIPSPKTAYAKIRKLQPGYTLAYENCGIHVRQFWDAPLGRSCPVHSLNAAVEMVRETLHEIVPLHMVSDVPVGVFLSGGLDSSTVTALMAKESPGAVRSFSIGFDVAEHSETRYARLVAKRYQTLHDERIVGVKSVQHMLPRIVQMYDEPYADGSAVPTYRVSSVARERVKVVLSGDGGDEIFAGYKWYSSWLQMRLLDILPLSVRRSVLATLRGGLPNNWPDKKFGFDFIAKGPLERYARLLELFSPKEKRRILTREWSREFADYDDYWYFRKYWVESLDPITRMQYLDLKTYLPDDILTKVDRASMAVCLEVRPPLLDHVLVERVFSIPGRFRAPNGQKKYLLKHAVQGLLPSAIIHRSKKGFSAPWTTWMRIERQWVGEFLKSSGGEGGLLREDIAEDPVLFKKGSKVWALLVLQQWAMNESISRGRE
jgi:asparagine synthase (glutamine-hydrolysing)